MRFVRLGQRFRDRLGLRFGDCLFASVYVGIRIPSHAGFLAVSTCQRLWGGPVRFVRLALRVGDRRGRRFLRLLVYRWTLPFPPLGHSGFEDHCCSIASILVGRLTDPCSETLHCSRQVPTPQC